MSKQFSDSDKEKIKSMFEQFKNRAEKILLDTQKIQEALKRSFEKAIINKGPLSEVFYQLKLLLSLVKDYISGEYRDIPYGSIIAAIGGILYFLSPIDFIPDFIPGIGLIDDVFVIGLVLKQIQDDLHKYQVWKYHQSESDKL